MGNGTLGLSLRGEFFNFIRLELLVALVQLVAHTLTATHGPAALSNSGLEIQARLRLYRQ
jgi:hypothetical protein